MLHTSLFQFHIKWSNGLMHKYSQISTTPCGLPEASIEPTVCLFLLFFPPSISTVPRTQSAPLTNTLAFIFTQIYTCSHIYRHPYSTTPHSLCVSLTHVDTHIHTHTPGRALKQHLLLPSSPHCRLPFPESHSEGVAGGREKGRKEIMVYVLA